MSNEIQSISQSNYVLHNIDAKKLYVQEPLFTANSGDAVYVGWRPDETVLWEGTLQTTADSASLNESWKNFDSLRFYCAPGNQPNQRAPIIHNISMETISTAGNFFSYLPVFNIASNSCTGEVLYVTGSNNGTTIGMLGGTRSVNFGAATTGVTSYNATIQKIVGVNRKENA